MTVYRLDQCKVCHRWVDRSTLRRCKVTHLQGPAENRFLYSSPILGGWSTTATEEAVHALGASIDSYYRLNSDNTWTLINGAKTYSGTGYLYSSTVYDCSTWVSLLFRVRIGCREDYSDRFEVVLGISEAGNVNPQPLKTYTSPWKNRYAYTGVATALLAPYDLAALCFYVHVTPDTAGTVWWADQFQLVANPTGFTPGTKIVVPAADMTVSTTIPAEAYPFVKTTGAAVVYTGDNVLTAVEPVCPKCRNEYLRVSSERISIEEPTEPLEDDGRVNDGIWR